MQTTKETNELSGEPRNTYLNRLILMTSYIDNNIYFSKAPVSACVTQMRGLIHFLDADSKKDLKDIIDRLIRYDRNINLIRFRTDVEAIFSEITDHLHQKYFLECHFAKPKYKPRGVKV